MPTFEEIMAVRPPEDVIVELNEFATEMGQTMEEIKNVFYNILAQPFLDCFEDMDERCRQASKVLMAQIADKLTSGGRKACMEFRIIDMTGVRVVDSEKEKEDPITHEMVKVKEKLPVATVYGLFGGYGEDEDLSSKFGILTLWGDATEMISKFKRDHDYRASLGIKNVFDNRYELTLNDVVAIEEIKLDLPSTKDMIADFFDYFPVSQAMYHQDDMQMIKGRVKSTWTGLSKKGSSMGRLTLIDDTTSISSLKTHPKESEITILFMNAPEFATKYGKGSEVYSLVDISSSDQYGLSAFGHCVIPIVAIPADIGSFLNSGGAGSQTRVPSSPSAEQSKLPDEGEKTKENVPSPASMSAW